MGFCGSTFKFFVFFFNFIFFLAGLGIIGIGSYMAIKMGDYFDFLGTSDLAPGVGLSAYIFIGIGVLVTVIAFFGCCAACTDNSCMMYTFASLMAIILIAEVGVAIAAFVFKGEATDFVSDAMKNGLKNYGNAEYEGVNKGWDSIQEQFKCCGVDGPNDWANSTELEPIGTTVPDSCCTNAATNCGKEKLDPPISGIYTDGCLDQFVQYVENNIYLIGGAGIGIAVVQLIAVIAACCLGKRMKGDNDYV